MGQIQSASNSGNATTLAVGATQGWATPTAGNLLVAWANADTTVTVDSSFTLRASVVDGNGVYLWSKVAAGTESTITFSLSGGAPGTVGVLEYDGTDATPFDVKNTSTITGSAGTTTTATSITTTDAAGCVMVAVAGIHGFDLFNTPTDPVWTNGFGSVQVVDTGGFSSTDCATFVAERIVGSSDTYSTGCTWTYTALDRQQLIAAFSLNAVASPGDDPNVTLFIGPTRGRS